MIDDIVEMILKEAEKVKNPDPVSRLYNVTMCVDRAVENLMDSIKDQERREIENENKAGDFRQGHG